MATPLRVGFEIIPFGSNAFNASDEELGGGSEQPRGGRGDGLLEVLGEAAVPVEPGQRALVALVAWENFEALGGVGTLDDLDSPFANPAQCIPEFVSGVAAIGEDMA